MLRFDVVHEATVTLDLDEPYPPLPPAEPMTDLDRKLAAYRNRNERVNALKRLPGFGGFTRDRRYDVVIDGVPVALTPRLFS